MYRKPRSSQRATHRAADGHVERSPTAHDPHRATPATLTPHPTGTNNPAHFGPRKDRETIILDNNMRERARTNPSPLAKRNTKFITNFTGQVRIPTNLVGADRDVAGDQPDGPRCVYVGEVPED